MPSKQGPGLWWQLLEFMGMTWPGKAEVVPVEPGPPCLACGNPSEKVAGHWRCPHHPNADVTDEVAES